MDENRIKQLKEKRLEQNKEIRLKELRKKIATELSYLEGQNFSYKIFYDSEYVNWINENVKVRNKDGYRGSHGDFQIDVKDSAIIPIKATIEDNYLNTPSIVDFFNEISDDTMLIVCSLINKPELAITKEAFLSNPSIFFSNPETWVLSADKKYIIENIRNQGAIRFIEIAQPEPILRVIIS